MMERGLQFWLPTITWPLARTTGEAAFTDRAINMSDGLILEGVSDELSATLKK